jgi:cytochrome oxidase Cu insertion factor (SCO1/SenC/PrrC family)
LEEHCVTPDVLAAWSQLRVFARRSSDPDDDDDDEGYVVPHSAIAYVLGPTGEFIAHFTDATEAAEMAKAFIEVSGPRSKAPAVRGCLPRSACW